MSQLCPVDGCNKVLKARGLTQHLRRMHPNFDLKLEDFEHPTPPPRAGSPDLESRDVNLPPQSPLDRQRISAREQLPNLAQMLSPSQSQSVQNGPDDEYFDSEDDLPPLAEISDSEYDESESDSEDDHGADFGAFDGQDSNAEESDGETNRKLFSDVYYERHSVVTGDPCTVDGAPLPAGNRAPPVRSGSASASQPQRSDWSPFADRDAFELADFLFSDEQMSAGNIDALLSIWSSAAAKYRGSPPFRNHDELYETIDCISHGGTPWRHFSVGYNGSVDPESTDVPPWMKEQFSIYYRDPREIAIGMLANPDFKDEIDFGPLRERDSNGQRRLRDFMGGNWSWRQADKIATYANSEGSSFVPIILGSDKTTVSVATGQNEYYPLYLSIGNVHNNVRRAHRNAVSVIAFLAIPKTTRQHANSLEFRKFRRQLFHSSLSRILLSLRPGMETAEIVCCGDGHYRKVFYGLGPYIADYPEQALVSCIVQNWCPTCLAPRTDLDSGSADGNRNQEHTELLVRQFELGTLWDDYGIVGDVAPFTNDFPRADIHELISPDILHQLIKGTFKDHLVTWAEIYLKKEYGETKSMDLLAQIDRRIAVVPPFSGLRQFHEGRGFKQWTGDDSKALMKVYLPAIDGILPDKMVATFRDFLDFSYLARRDVHTPQTVELMEKTLNSFRQNRKIFETTGVRTKSPRGGTEPFSLPRQHSMEHYPDHIFEFGAPNGLCSSITESKHIKAVKEPWRRSNRFQALGQMLRTNQRLDRLAAARVDFANRGMLGEMRGASSAALGHDSVAATDLHLHEQSHDAVTPEDEDGAVHGPTVLAYVTMARTAQRITQRTADALEGRYQIRNLRNLIRQYLYDKLNPDSTIPRANLPPDLCPPFTNESINIYHSAAATFYAPSDPSGIGGMRREYIRATPQWRSGPPRYDCVFVNRDDTLPGLLGMAVARVRLFFSFKYEGMVHDCAAVHWFRRIDDEPDKDTGMWVVQPESRRVGRSKAPLISVIDLGTIVRAAHLIGVSIGQEVPADQQSHDSLDTFTQFFVNKYIDHHAFEMLHYPPITSPA